MNRNSILPSLTTITASTSLILLFLGCSASEKKEPELKELKAASSTTIDLSDRELFEQAKRHYTISLYSAAQGDFETLRDSFPSGPYREFAEIKIADSMFEQHEYLPAAAAYEDFVKNTPTSAAAPYATMRAGRSYQLAARGVGRDMTSVEKSVDLYDQLIKRYPTSPYAESARELRHSALEMLAEHERFISEFYEKKENEKAAAIREASFKERSKKVTDEDKKSKEILVSHTLKNSGALSSPAILKATIVRPKREKLVPPQVVGVGATRNISKQQLSTDNSNSLTSESNAHGMFIERVECQLKGQRIVAIYLSGIKESPSISAGKVTGRGNSLMVKIPNTAAQAEVQDCFGKGDLSIGKDGTVSVVGSLPTGVSAQVMSVDSPPRVLLVLD